MVVSCWVRGCSNSRNKVVKRGFFYIPKVRIHEGEQTQKLSEERRQAWIDNINRNEPPSKTSRICSDHFVSGKPAALYDRKNPDWAPTLKLEFVKKVRRTAETGLKRYQRWQQTQSQMAARALVFIAGYHNEGNVKQQMQRDTAARALIELSSPKTVAKPSSDHVFKGGTPKSELPNMEKCDNEQL